ncbi:MULTISPECIES: AraC family transcriptional regulator [unclassified Ensifer]|uniref:helix-turn-helix domain-containing protein n=1 Tax=unclassified Ensifer TaxID=2633371 RepID=UPI0008136E47|nr:MULTISPECIES: AraC family transcriptional regulator [unclassified Ensifer]OCP05669.1 AraC family transcriptional regulator [Ensifer sp. LC11]OCP06411.1 AraC family transcriptional regulator [Ensifer sp. LC13]OCP06863.1 AraC family transcriptional regulator [Ensifer sp. LC14]OCP31350.1 AraC family transcriptional regulator [Ensifer sp. LC499]
MTGTIATSAAAPPRDSLGCSRDQLDDDRMIEGRDMLLYRKKSAAGPPGRVTTPGNGRGYLIGLSLAGGHDRRVFQEHHSTIQEFGPNSIYVRSFADDYKADLSGSFDFALLEIGHGALERIADAADLAGVSELRSLAGSPDPVLGGMLGALFATVDGRTDRSALFVDQLSVAIGVHVVRQYGNGRGGTPSGGRRLSQRCQARIRDLVQSRLDGELTVEELAVACNLSQATFLRAFRETMGSTPYRWLLQQRIEKAKHLLHFSQTPLSEIATACGFSDQSHFTRAFVQAVGTTPRVWRRSR